MRETYKTKQKEALIQYMESTKHTHTTISEIAAHFQNSSNPIGATTIYRHLEKLVQDGRVKKFHLGHIASTCYQYVDEEGCDTHYHFKCNSCGKIFHIHCATLDHIQEHVYSEHKFLTDISNTIFVGTCEECRRP